MVSKGDPSIRLEFSVGGKLMTNLTVITVFPLVEVLAVFSLIAVIGLMTLMVDNLWTNVMKNEL